MGVSPLRTLLSDGLSSQSQRTLITSGLGLLLFEFAPGIAIAVLALPSVALVLATSGALAVQAEAATLEVVAVPSAGTLQA